MIVGEPNTAKKSKTDVLISIGLFCLWPLLFFTFLWVPQLWSRPEDPLKDVDSELGAMAVGVGVAANAGAVVISSGFWSFVVTMLIVVIVGFWRRTRSKPLPE